MSQTDDRVSLVEWCVHLYVGLVVLFYTMTIYYTCRFYYAGADVRVGLDRALSMTWAQWTVSPFEINSVVDGVIFAIDVVLIPGLVIGFFPVLVYLLLAAGCLFGDLSPSIRLPCESIFAVPIFTYLVFIRFAHPGTFEYALGWLFPLSSNRPPDSIREGEIMTNDQEENLRSEIVALQRRNPDFPAVPTALDDYGGWFEEVRKRGALRSQQRTVDERLKLLQKITAVHEEYLKLVRAKGDVTRLPRAQRIEDRKLDLEERRVEYEIAELEEKTRDRRRPKLPPQTPDPAAAIQDEIISTVRSLAALDQLQVRVNRGDFGDVSDPRIASQIARMFERARVRLSH